MPFVRETDWNLSQYSSWPKTLVAILFVLGFPVAMYSAWRFDTGPDAIQRTGVATAFAEQGIGDRPLWRPSLASNPARLAVLLSDVEKALNELEAVFMCGASGT